MQKGLVKLEQQVAMLAEKAVEFDKAKWFEKNRFIQNKHGLFDSPLFASKSLLLQDYVDEIALSLKHLPATSQRHAFAFAIEKIGMQVESVVKVLQATPVWAKENRSSPKAKAQVYRKAVAKIMQSSHELYQELSQNHEFERRLQAMITERQSQLDSANSDTARQQLHAEILALHARLGRCRKAISATEDKIVALEKQSR
ncbi:primosomal replication protein [Pseudoalteromonas fenneropenaei]|uniref:Primosomal replication protein n=1 Tax=Pseudoalteromonas fenneropenaei TaxID=1737459 RepID=A0ABV7CLT4_9GAMM